MRDRTSPAALPRAPDEGERAGLRVVPDPFTTHVIDPDWQFDTILAPTEPKRTDGVRCPNPKCRKKLAEDLTGTLVMTCRYCNQRVTITR